MSDASEAGSERSVPPTLDLPQGPPAGSQAAAAATATASPPSRSHKLNPTTTPYQYHPPTVSAHGGDGGGPAGVGHLSEQFQGLSWHNLPPGAAPPQPVPPVPPPPLGTLPPPPLGVLPGGIYPPAVGGIGPYPVQQVVPVTSRIYTVVHIIFLRCVAMFISFQACASFGFMGRRTAVQRILCASIRRRMLRTSHFSLSLPSPPLPASRPLPSHPPTHKSTHSTNRRSAPPPKHARCRVTRLSIHRPIRSNTEHHHPLVALRVPRTS